MAALLALSAAACWGIADFIGGLQARRLPVLWTAMVTQFAGAGLLGSILLVARVAPLGGPDTAIALATGLANAVGVYTLYTALALGPMARVAPILGAAALVPLAVGLASGERPAPSQLVGVVTAMTGIVLISTERSLSEFSMDDRSSTCRRSYTLRWRA